MDKAHTFRDCAAYPDGDIRVELFFSPNPTLAGNASRFPPMKTCLFGECLWICGRSIHS
jgi:hypothetical protein